LLTARTWWTGAIVLALSILVRPSAMLLPVTLAIPLAISNSQDRRQLILRPLVSAALVLVVLFPWAFRNHRVIDRWVWTTSNAGVTLYDGFNVAATGGSDQRFLAGMAQWLRQIPNEVDRSDYLAAEARRFVRDLPERAILLTFKKIARTWSPIPLSAEAGQSPLLMLVAAIYSVPLFALTIAGLLRANLPPRAKVFLLIPAIYFTAIHAVSVGSLRYRLPADVPMAAVAASTIKRSEGRGQRAGIVS